jgi:hypothetical protein
MSKSARQKKALSLVSFPRDRFVYGRLSLAATRPPHAGRSGRARHNTCGQLLRTWPSCPPYNAYRTAQKLSQVRHDFIQSRNGHAYARWLLTFSRRCFFVFAKTIRQILPLQRLASNFRSWLWCFNSVINFVTQGTVVTIKKNLATVIL